MKRIIFLITAAVLLLMSGAGLSQTIIMDDVYLSFDYPQSWLVVSPQLARVYAPLLEAEGMDAKALSEELQMQGIHSRAYNADFSQWMSVLTKKDELSQEIFDISRATEDQRKAIRSSAENNRFWETTGYRAQDVEWHKEGGAYWLYVHYTRVYADKIVGRGLRYMTVRNGMYVMIDWQIEEGRFSNRDLRDFRARTHDLAVTRQLDMPKMTVRLDAALPTETSVGELKITGKSTPGAALVLEAPDGSGALHTLAVSEADAGGSFTLQVSLEEEGIYDLTLSGMLMYAFAPAMIGIMSPDPAVVALGARVLRIEAFAEPLFAASIVAAGVFRGAGDTLMPSVFNFITMWAVRLPVAAFLAPRIGLVGVWVAMFCDLTTGGVLFLIRLRGSRWLKAHERLI